MSFQHRYKESPPLQTIQQIRNILAEANILVMEKQWQNETGHCSVRLEFEGLPGIGVNGKGINAHYALASAYGELMERIQNRSVPYRTYGLCVPAEWVYPDQTYLSVDEVLHQEQILPHIVHHSSLAELSDLLVAHQNLLIGVPFLNAMSQQVEILPSTLIGLACGTNGMCAGNTPHEAMVQGISEIFERFVLKEMMTHEIVLPTIEKKMICMEPDIEAIIRSMEEAGYHVFIKDATLGGRYPVLGILVIDRLHSRYLLKLGAHPIFNIALERCVTEFFQGFSLQHFMQHSLPIQWDLDGADFLHRKNNIEKACKNGTGQFPLSIFTYQKANTDFQSAFIQKGYTNQVGFNFLLDRIKTDGKILFIRDVSFLHYPAYKLYVPGMSEIFLQNVATIRRKMMIAQLQKVLLQLTDASEQDIELLIQYFENEPVTFLSQSQIFARSCINIREYDIDMRLLLSILYYRLNRYDSCLRYLRMYQEHLEKSGTDVRYYHCAYFMIQGKSIGRSFLEMQELLCPIYNDSLIREVWEDLYKKEYSIPIPNCPHCHACELKVRCNKDAWHSISSVLHEKMTAYFPVQSLLPKLINPS